MNHIELPALVGNSPTGFLAALGVVQLCSTSLGDPRARVGWPDSPSRGALLETTVAEDIDGLVPLLASVAGALNAPNVVPSVQGFPPNSAKTADTDPIRAFSFASGRQLALNVRGDPHAEDWVMAVLALDEPITSEKRKGTLPVTPLAARGPGTVMLARTLAHLASRASHVEVVDAALRFWTREESTGGYLDPGAKRNAAHAASKRDLTNYGVPGAAWLALMALPMLRAQNVNADVAVAPGWTRTGGQQRYRWPVWTPLLDVAAIRVLLAHRTVVTDFSRPSDVERDLRSLGVAAVYESLRLAEGNNDGPLSSPIRVWPTARERTEPAWT